MVSGKEDSKKSLGTTDHRSSELQETVQDLELRLHQALQERDALLDHVLEQRGTNSVCNRSLPASDIDSSSIQLF
jgi:hypothetical protein